MPRLDYRKFFTHLRKIELERAYLVINDNVSPKLFGYVVSLNQIEFVDGLYHTYCGEVKNIVNAFITYWSDVINDAVKEVDKYNNVITKEELLALMEKSIVIHEAKQSTFENEYSPPQSLKEREIFKWIKEKHKQFMESLFEMRTKLQRFDTQEQVFEFAKVNFEISLQRKTALLEFTHIYISLALAEHMDQIRISLEETLSRVRTNLKERQDEREDLLNDCLQELYEKNKERIALARQERRSSGDQAEVEVAIAKIKAKVEDYQQNTPIIRLENEVYYWQSRLQDFGRIERTVLKLKAEQDNVIKQEEIYNSYKCMELPGSKLEAWLNIGENLKLRKQFIDDKHMDAARALLTFFAVRGTNRIYYRDSVGLYMIDEFGHQIYIFDHGRYMYHLACDGSYRPIKDLDKYYYDNDGRYVIGENNKKIYQCAPCTSTYDLTDEDLFVKTTKDCGHSDKQNKACKMEMKDPVDVEILPNSTPVDIKKSLTTEVVNYLWKNVAHILPYALYDVKAQTSNNPIHRLAHGLVLHKYYRSIKEVEETRKEVDTYLDNVHQKKKEKLVAASKAWKAKQFKRRKPEESDDTEERAVYNAYIDQYRNICSWYNT